MNTSVILLGKELTKHQSVAVVGLAAVGAVTITKATISKVGDAAQKVKDKFHKRNERSLVDKVLNRD